MPTIPTWRSLCIHLQNDPESTCQSSWFAEESNFDLTAKGIICIGDFLPGLSLTIIDKKSFLTLYECVHSPVELRILD